MKHAIAKMVRLIGYEIRKAGAFRPDFSNTEQHIVRRVQPYTMTSDERVVAVIDAVRYIVSAGIPGSIVECGVWKGGSMMAAALTLLELGATRDIYLFDTFEGMPAPTEHDRKTNGEPAIVKFAKLRTAEGSKWCDATLEEVRAALQSTGYQMDRVILIKGKVEDTIPKSAPQQIALLRLDTDWYESTKHELIHLYPRLSSGGVLIIDDYGSWEGARKAVDEYFARIPILLSRIDVAGRMAVRV